MENKTVREDTAIGHPSVPNMTRRAIGRRVQRPIGILAPPTAEEIAWREAMAQTRTRVPKGVFRYSTQEAANADWERWQVDLVAATVRRKPESAASAPEAQSPDAYTRPATWRDVLTTVRLLNRAGVRYVLVGGYALAANGYVRMTEDIDIAVAPDPENSARWIAALAALPDGASKTLIGESDPFEGDYLHAIRINDEFTVDILPSVAGVSFAELEGHIVWFDLEGEHTPVLDLVGLLKTKQGVRPKDQADARILSEALRRLGEPESSGR